MDIEAILRQVVENYRKNYHLHPGCHGKYPGRILLKLLSKEMDNTPEPDPNEATQQLAIAIGALTISLIDKGVITQAEYDHAYAQATNIVDQEFARKRDQQGKGEP